MSLKLDGKKLSLEIEERLSNYISSNEKIAKRAPGLAVIRIGEDPASGVYVKVCDSYDDVYADQLIEVLDHMIEGRQYDR